MIRYRPVDLHKTMNALLKQLDDLKAQWLAAQPLSPAKDEELWRKFRLEWNYNSNHIEGNTLTYGETELLLIMGQTKGDHTIREYDEMKAHDIAVKKIRELATTHEILRETDVRDLNKIILKEPYWAEAVTEYGQPTRVEIIPGEYKRLPNNVKSPTGESVLFASPTDTPARMGDLVKWMHGELEKPTLHAVEFAAALHHRFLCIHPFADGNGRVARLLANYVLMRAEFPPLIVKSRDKANYIAALRNADVGDGERLAEYFTSGVRWSLEMALRAARGEPIAEPGDTEKEVAIFIKQHAGNEAEALTCSPEAIELSLDRGLRDLLNELQRKLMTLAPLFERCGCEGSDLRSLSSWDVLLIEESKKSPSAPGRDFWIVFSGYKPVCRAPFDVKFHSTVSWQRARYIVSCHRSLPIVKRYGEPITSEEIEAFTETALKEAFADIKCEAGEGEK